MARWPIAATRSIGEQGTRCTRRAGPPGWAIGGAVGLASLGGILVHNAEAWDRGKDEGKASLRRLQYDSAKKGNVTAQIWLGKQWLNQKDKSETELSGKDGEPIQITKIEIVAVMPDGTYWDRDAGRPANIHDRDKPAIEHVPVAAGDSRNGGRS